MKNHILLAHSRFNDGCNRSRDLKSIFEFFKKKGPAALNCDDILRSALVLAVSSFDLFMHDLVRLEVVHRLMEKREVNSLRIPFNALIIDKNDWNDMIGEYLRKENSYKSFVAPDKMAECLRVFFEKPWDKIASSLSMETEVAKSSLRSVVDLRNRIAHEADVNPIYGGIGLWPIYIEDVEESIVFLSRLGAAIAKVVNDS